MDFKISIAESLCMIGEQIRSERPSTTISKQIELKRKRPNTTHIPPKEVRKDNIGHTAKWMKVRLGCKLPGCGKLTYIRCKKCSVHLCFNKDRDCFEDFHK